MTPAVAGRAPATFEIKSANLPLVALLLKSADLGQLAVELAIRFGDIPDFFDNDPLVVDLSPLQGHGGIDFASLLALLKTYRLHPVAVRGGSPDQMAAALHAGLANAPDVEWPGLRAVTAERDEDGLRQAQPERSEAGGSATVRPELVEGRARNHTSDREAPPSGFDSTLPPEPARGELVEARLPPLVIDKPLRSGQQVYARGRDLIALAMVNAGAEVIADGHIHVYAPLRGKAIAGARGNGDARIFTLSLDPELVSIAGVYRTSDTPLPAQLQGKPAQIYLAGNAADGKLVIEAIKA